MQPPLFLSYGDSPSLTAACCELQKAGIRFIDHPAPEVNFLLTDVPCKMPLVPFLERLPESITVIGGNLSNFVSPETVTADLLENEEYLWNNAAITARCALRLASGYINCTFDRCPILIIGYGRIGIHLCAILKALGADLTVAARSVSAQAMAGSFHFRAVSLSSAPEAKKYKIIFNTVPALLYDCTQFPGSTIIDLASKPGISGNTVIRARGLPGKMAPDSSGSLIAKTVLSMLQGGNV